jgi:ABC-2 type transport system permease protein
MKSSVLESMQYRMSVLVMLFGNMMYLIIIYNLWKAIYASVDTPTVNGMTFADTMIYLVLASAQFSFMEAYLVWEMGRGIQNGDIIIQLIKPMSYESFQLFLIAGGNLFNFVVTFIPTFFIVQIVTDWAIPMGINLLYYLVAVILGSLINFAVDYFVGTICLYTHSVWGINIMKQILVTFLSGATVPLAFFPETLHKIVMFLPFHAIYNTPLTLLIHNDIPACEVGRMLFTQLIWVVVMMVIGKVFWKLSEKVITVNGG